MKTSPFQNNNIYEAERLNIELSQNDFCVEDKFDENELAKEEIYDYFKEKKFDRCVIENTSSDKKKITTSMDAEILNNIFYKTYTKFQKKISLIEFFSLFSDYFAIDPKMLYWDYLGSKIRMQLYNDLKESVNLSMFIK